MQFDGACFQMLLDSAVRYTATFYDKPDFRDLVLYFGKTDYYHLTWETGALIVLTPISVDHVQNLVADEF
jgi:hypothetical protein